MKRQTAPMSFILLTLFCMGLWACGAGGSGESASSNSGVNVDAGGLGFFPTGSGNDIGGQFVPVGDDRDGIQEGRSLCENELRNRIGLEISEVRWPMNTLEGIEWAENPAYPRFTSSTLQKQFLEPGREIFDLEDIKAGRREPLLIYTGQIHDPHVPIGLDSSLEKEEPQTRIQFDIKLLNRERVEPENLAYLHIHFKKIKDLDELYEINRLQIVPYSEEEGLSMTSGLVEQPYQPNSNNKLLARFFDEALGPQYPYFGIFDQTDLKAPWNIPLINGLWSAPQDYTVVGQICSFPVKNADGSEEWVNSNMIFFQIRPGYVD